MSSGGFIGVQPVMCVNPTKCSSKFQCCPADVCLFFDGRRAALLPTFMHSLLRAMPCCLICFGSQWSSVLNRPDFAGAGVHCSLWGMFGSLHEEFAATTFRILCLLYEHCQEKKSRTRHWSRNFLSFSQKLFYFDLLRQSCCVLHEAAEELLQVAVCVSMP